jgi:hypothetical protein
LAALVGRAQPATKTFKTSIHYEAHAAGMAVAVALLWATALLLEWKI